MGGCPDLLWGEAAQTSGLILESPSCGLIQQPRSSPGSHGWAPNSFWVGKGQQTASSVTGSVCLCGLSQLPALSGLRGPKAVTHGPFLLPFSSPSTVQISP